MGAWWLATGASKNRHILADNLQIPSSCATTPNPHLDGRGKTPAWNISSRIPNPYADDISGIGVPYFGGHHHRYCESNVQRTLRHLVDCQGSRRTAGPRKLPHLHCGTMYHSRKWPYKCFGPFQSPIPTAFLHGVDHQLNITLPLQ